jgi:hypothetical protein
VLSLCRRIEIFYWLAATRPASPLLFSPLLTPARERVVAVAAEV